MATITLETKALLSLETVSDLRKGPHQRQMIRSHDFVSWLSNKTTMLLINTSLALYFFQLKT